MSFQLLGGSEGLAQLQTMGRSFEQTRRIPMFEIKDLYPSVMHANSTNFSCVILPAFDYSLNPADPAFKESYVPYKDKSKWDAKNSKYGFTPWFNSFLAYRYYGKGMSTFMSPKSGGYPDPIVDLCDYVQSAAKMGDNTYKYLMTRHAPKSGEFTALLNPSPVHILNIWGSNTNVRSKDQEVKNRILLLNSVAFDHLTKLLHTAGMTDDPDPNWPNFSYGDPTDPNRAIVCTPMAYSTTMSGSNSTVSCQVLNLGEVVPQGNGVHLSVRRMQITPAMLRGRYNLCDLVNVLHVPTYDEIVELLVDEGLVPYDLIEKVCSDKCEHFPARAKKATYSIPTTQQQQFQQPASIAPAAAAAPMPQPTKQAPYATLTPTPAHPASMDAKLGSYPENPNDQLPGLEIPAAGRTQEEENELVTLRGKIESNQASKDDFMRYTELMKKPPFRQ